MSWDVIILNYKDNPPDFNNLPDDFQPPIIGLKSEIREKINIVFNSVDWSDPDWGISKCNGFSIEFSLPKDDSPTSIALHIRGGGDPIPLIVQMCKLNNWSAFDTSTGKWIDLNKPNKKGWDDWQKYRNRVVFDE